MKHFGSIDAVKKAAIDEIASLKGMNRKIAEDLKEALGLAAKAQRHKE